MGAEREGARWMNALKRLIPLALCAALGVVLALWSNAWGQGFRRLSMHNGFDLSYSVVPREEILPGGPPKDGIPALTDPRLLKAAEARYLYPRDLVLGVVFGGEARAYPLRILVWHENANDVVGGVPIAVTYCPLCNSAFVFDRRIGGQVREFGVSGLLWNSNVLLYDRQPDPLRESLWSQVKMAAVTGPAALSGHRMKFLPSELTTWAEWASQHPATMVLSDKTGYARDYGHSPYGSYFATDRLMFPARGGRKSPERFRKKEPMVLVQVGEKLKAYAVRDVAASVGDEGSIEDRVGGKMLRLTYVNPGDTVRVETLSGDGEQVPVAYSFWFAVNAIMPDVELFEPPARHAVSGKTRPSTSRAR
jgi:hypothetical protein